MKKVSYTVQIQKKYQYHSHVMTIQDSCFYKLVQFYKPKVGSSEICPQPGMANIALTHHAWFPNPHPTDSSCVSFLGHVATSMCTSNMPGPSIRDTTAVSLVVALAAKEVKAQTTLSAACRPLCQNDANVIQTVLSARQAPMSLWYYNFGVTSPARKDACTTSSLLGRCLSRTVHWTKRP